MTSKIICLYHKMQFLFSVLVCLGMSRVTFCSSVNYCGAKMCGHSDKHTFCQFAPGPSPNCSGYMEARLTSSEKSRIIARLNRRRSECAKGMLSHLPPAANMLKLRWVEELSREAQRWADQCVPPSSPEKHDGCRDLYSTTVGQCVWSVVGESPGLRVESLVDVWYMQNKYYNGNVSFYTSSEKPYYGDFAQIVWAKTYLVGCARSKFMTLWKGRMRSVERLVCNFAPRGPIPQRPLWMQGPPATLCPARSTPDANLSALCNFQTNLNEKHDVKNTMSLEEHALLDAALKVESNESLNHPGCLDELYLTKLTIDDMKMSDNNLVVSLNNMIKKTSPNYISTESTGGNQIENKGTNNEESSKIKLSLVGRPKSYNFEELTDPNLERENQMEAITEEMVQTDRGIYDDYEFKDKIENLSKHFNGSNDISVLLDEIDNTIGVTLENFRELNARTKYHIKINAENDESTEQPVSTQMDDYLSDPETLQQLQDALDRMEHTVSSTDGTSGKVRRELRSFPEHQIESNTVEPVSKYKEKKQPEVQAASEPGAVVRMMMKYAPYVKNYGSSFLGRNGSSKPILWWPMFYIVILFL